MSNIPHGVPASLHSWSAARDPGALGSDTVGSQRSSDTEPANSPDVRSNAIDPNSNGFPNHFLSQPSSNQTEAAYFGQNDFVNPPSGAAAFAVDHHAFGGRYRQDHVPRTHTIPDGTWLHTVAATTYGIRNIEPESARVGTYFSGAHESAPRLPLGSQIEPTGAEYSQPIAAGAGDAATNLLHAAEAKFDDPRIIASHGAFEPREEACPVGVSGSPKPLLSHNDKATYPGLLFTGPAEGASERHAACYVKSVASPSAAGDFAHMTSNAFDDSRLTTSQMHEFGSTPLAEGTYTRMYTQSGSAVDSYASANQQPFMARAYDEPIGSVSVVHGGNDHVPRYTARDRGGTLGESEVEPEHPDGRRHSHPHTSSSVASGVSKPDILGEPCSSVLSAQDDSVQPDILAEPILHHPRQHAEGKLPVGTTASVPALPEEQAGQVFAGQLSQPEQHSMAIGYEPISPHSQSAFKPVTTGGRLGRTEGSSLHRDPTPPALWQNDAALQPAIFLQPIGSGQLQFGAASAASSLVPANSKQSSGLVVADANGKEDIVTVLHGGFRTEQTAMEGAAALQTQPHSNADMPSMPNFGPETATRASGDRAAPSAPAVVPHPVPVPIFVPSLQPPRDATGLLSNFSPNRHNVSPEMFVGQTGSVIAGPGDLPSDHLPLSLSHASDSSSGRLGVPHAFAAPVQTEQSHALPVRHGTASGRGQSSPVMHSSAVSSHLSTAVSGDVDNRPSVIHSLPSQRSMPQQLRADVAASHPGQVVEPVQVPGAIGERPDEVGRNQAAVTVSALTQSQHDSHLSATPTTQASHSGALLPGQFPLDDSRVFPKEIGRPAGNFADHSQTTTRTLANTAFPTSSSAPSRISEAPALSAGYVQAQTDSSSAAASHRVLPGQQGTAAIARDNRSAVDPSMAPVGSLHSRDGSHLAGVALPVKAGEMAATGGGYMSGSHLPVNSQHITEHAPVGRALPPVQPGPADYRMPLGGAYTGYADQSTHSHDSLMASGTTATGSAALHASNYPSMPSGNADFRSSAYYGPQPSQGAPLQQNTPALGAQGYPAQIGYGLPNNAAVHQTTYDRRAPSAPPTNSYPVYGDYYGSHLGGNGFGHYLHQDPYGGYANRGYGYDRHPQSYYDYRGSYQRGYMDELSAYAQQQAAAAAYGSLYDYYQQCQQYYNAMQENQAQGAHSRSSSRAVTPAIHGREERSSYADSSYYPSRPESAASIGTLPNSSLVVETSAAVINAHDVSLDAHNFSTAGLGTDVTIGFNNYYQDNIYGTNDVATTLDTAQPVTTVPPRTTPICFPLPHARVSFGKCGQLITVLPSNPAEGQPAIVQVHDLRHFFEQSEADAYDSRSTRGLVLPDHANLSFPLIRGQTHKKDVIDFCDRQADKCRSSVDMHDRESSELMWRFLALLIKQNGTFIGSDVAELLLADQESVLNSYKRHPQVQDAASLGPGNQRTVDVLTDRYRELLLYGHVKEALDYSVKNELWGHALVLASKMDSRTQASVMARFTTMSMRSNDPLQTLYQLMSNKQPSVVTSIVDDKWGSWRPHLAMMLVNGSGAGSALIQQSIAQLGDTLSAKGQLVASQFCYIMAGLPFEGYSRKSSKLSLLGAHSRMPEQEFLAPEHVEWTEVYEYAQSLGNPVFVMSSLQTYKLVKAWNLLECGHLGEALRYCEAIAEKVLGDCSKFCTELVKQLVELSAVLKNQDTELLHNLGTSGLVSAGGGDGCSPWIDQLSALLERMETGSHDRQFAQLTATDVRSTNFESSHAGGVLTSAVGAGDSSTESTIQYLVQDRFTNSAQLSAPATVTTSSADDQETASTSAHTNAPATLLWASHLENQTATMPPVRSYENTLPSPPWAPGDNASQFGQHTYDHNSGVFLQQPYPEQQQQYIAQRGPYDDTLSSASDDTAESSQSADEDYRPPADITVAKSAAVEPKEAKQTKEANAEEAPKRTRWPWIFGRKPKTPKPTEMKLPDDKEKTIVWDEKLKKWVNTDGDNEEDKSVGPPPMGAPPPGSGPTIMGRGRRAPTYVDPFKGTASVTKSPLPSLLNDGLSGNRSLNVLTPLNVVASQSNANGTTAMEQQLISRNESSASLEVQTIMGSDSQYSGAATAGQPTSHTPSTAHATSGQPAAAPALVPAAGPAFFNPMQFSQSTIPISSAKQRLNRRV